MELPPMKKMKIDLSQADDAPKKTTLTVWVDGASKNNGKKHAKAGYGIYFGDNDPRNIGRALDAGQEQTNQRAELTAILEALRIMTNDAGYSKDKYRIVVVSDSLYSINCISIWYHNWEKNGFQTANKQPVKNLDIITPARKLYKEHDVSFVHVRGHQKNPTDINAINNNKVDELASKSIRP